MNITIKPWNPGDGGLICLPLRSNIPDASKHPDWRFVTCPSCGRECWESQAVANVKAYLTEALKDIPDRDKITIIA